MHHVGFIILIIIFVSDDFWRITLQQAEHLNANQIYFLYRIINQIEREIWRRIVCEWKWVSGPDQNGS
jgi:hypothetical protein